MLYMWQCVSDTIVIANNGKYLQLIIWSKDGI